MHPFLFISLAFVCLLSSQTVTDLYQQLRPSPTETEINEVVRQTPRVVVRATNDPLSFFHSELRTNQVLKQLLKGSDDTGLGLIGPDQDPLFGCEDEDESVERWEDYEKALREGKKLDKDFFMKALKSTWFDEGSPDAEFVAQKMVEHGFEMCMAAHRFLLSHYCKKAEWDFNWKIVNSSLESQRRAEAYFEEMIEKGLTPSQRSYQRMMAMYRELRKPELLEELFYRSLRHGVRPTRAVCNMALEVYRDLGKVSHAMWLYKIMLKNKIRPNSHTHHVMFSIFNNLDDLKRSETEFRQIPKKDNPPTRKMFTMYVKHKELKKAKKVLQAHIQRREQRSRKLENFLQILSLLSETGPDTPSTGGPKKGKGKGRPFQ